MPPPMPLEATTIANAPAPPIRVFIAEDHAITLFGLQRLVDGSATPMRVVGSASSLKQLLQDSSLIDVDVLLLDLDLDGEDSAKSLPELLARCTGRVLVLTGNDDTSTHSAAVMRGARGVVHKSRPPTLILKAIEKVHLGEIWLEGGLLGSVLDRLTAPAARPGAPPARDPVAERIASLTRREREIVSTMVRSAGAKQLAVADELGMSENTLRNHLTAIYQKLAVRGRLELHVFATEHGLGRDAAG